MISQLGKDLLTIIPIDDPMHIDGANKAAIV